MQNIEKKLDFHPDVPHSEEHNIMAAEQREWIYDSQKECYVDSDDEMAADRFGQPLG